MERDKQGRNNNFIQVPLPSLLTERVYGGRQLQVSVSGSALATGRKGEGLCNGRERERAASCKVYRDQLANGV